MKRTYFYQFLFLLVLFWLEVGFKKVFPESFIIPQFVLVFVVVYAASRELKEILTMSMIGGFLGELFVGLYFGSVIFGFVTAGLLVYLVSRRVTAKDISLAGGVFLQLGATAILPLLILLYNFGVFGFGLTVGPHFGEFYSWQLVWRALANTAVFFPINAFFKTLFHE